MSDTGELSMTADDIVALRAERDALMAERDSERAAREAEARRADRNYTQFAEGSRHLATANVNSLAAQEAQAEGAITSITGEVSGLKSQYANLLAEGKFDEAADIQEKIADAAARRNQAQQAKTYFAGQREVAAKQPTDPVDQFLAKNNFSAEEQEWIKRNPRFATDPEFQARVTKAHNDIVAKGVAPKSPEYFAGLEQAGYMRAPPSARQDPPTRTAVGGAAALVEGGDADNPYSEAAQDVVVEEPVQTPPARQPTRAGVAASPSHRAPATPQRDPPGQVRLTADEAQTALSLSELMPDEVLAEGEAGIYAYYNKLKNSPTAKRLKADWASGG